MTTKINELTEKIYKEGIEKANSEAAKILDDAKKQAEEIISNAKKQEAEVIENAKKQAENIKTNLDSELVLSSRQFISNLKLQVSNLITFNQINQPVAKALDDSEFIKNIILEIIKNWNPDNPEQLNLNISLSDKYKAELQNFSSKKTKENFDKGLEITFDNNIKTGFKIVPKDKDYIISFTDTDFENLFKNYLKDKNKNLIFEQNV